MNELEKLREEIDAIDEMTALLFERRMKAVSEIAQYKKLNNIDITDSEREKTVIEKGISYLSDKTLEEYYIEFQKNVMALSKRYQKDKISKS